MELSKVYLEEGEKALFSLLYVLGAFDEQGDGNFYRVYLTYTKDGQNTNVKLKDTPLGKSLTKEEVAKFNLESLKKSYGSYLQDEYKKYLNSCPDSECMDFETFSQSDFVEHKSLDDFESALTENQALLQQIYIDGVALEGFAPNKYDYALNYQGTFPTVTCDTLEGQEITTFRNGNTLTIYVIKDEDKAQYHLTFNTQLSDDC